MKVGNFKRNTHKLSYLYLSTPSGIEEKALLTVSFLKCKIAEHEKITQETAKLKEYISIQKNNRLSHTIKALMLESDQHQKAIKEFVVFKYDAK